MPLCRAGSPLEVCTPQPATMTTSAPAPMKKSLYTRSSTSPWVTQAGMLTLSPTVPGIHPDVQAGLVLFGSNMNVIGGHAPRAEAVLPNVVRAAEFCRCKSETWRRISRVISFIRTPPPASRNFPPWGNRASRSPSTSEAPPWRETLPPATTAISSAIFKIRS